MKDIYYYSWNLRLLNYLKDPFPPYVERKDESILLRFKMVLSCLRELDR